MATKSLRHVASAVTNENEKRLHTGRKNKTQQRSAELKYNSAQQKRKKSMFLCVGGSRFEYLTCVSSL